MPSGERAERVCVCVPENAPQNLAQMQINESDAIFEEIWGGSSNFYFTCNFLFYFFDK